jgi:predicted nucleotidyltransferase
LTNLKRTIEKIVSYAVSVTDPEEIVVFGSMINGTANVNSDLDLLIITESGINKKEAVARIRNQANQFSLKTDVLIYSKYEFEKEIKIENSFIKAVQKSGKIIYKKVK